MSNQRTLSSIQKKNDALLSAMSIMDGIELLIRRHQEVQHVSAGTFYLFKIYTLYELAIENDNENYGDVIKSVMDGSLKKEKKSFQRLTVSIGIYLVAKGFDKIDLASIQLVIEIQEITLKEY